MRKSTRNIIALIIIIAPFYLVSIFQKINGNIEYSIKTFFVEYILLAILGLLTIHLTNKYLLKNSINDFIKEKGSLILDISLGFLLLIVMYFIFSLGHITFNRWIPTDIDRTEIFELLGKIFSNKLYTILFLGPFIWLTEGFLAISRAFILNNLWEISSNKIWVWLSIIATAGLCSLTQIDNGIPAIINWVLIFMVTNIVYLKYRRIYPLIIAGILLQTIQLISVWVYSF